MDDRNEEVFKQYDIKIYNIHRTRGAFMLETNQGIKLYKAFEGSRNRVEFEYCIMEHLRNHEYRNVDLYLRNINGEIISKDSRGNSFVMKDWYEGNECNLKDLKDIEKASFNLSVLHSKMNHIEFSEEQIKYNVLTNLFELFEKHNRELKRVRSYVREKKQKNEFEVYFLGMYDSFFEQGCKAVDILKQSSYNKMLETACSNLQVCHGNYTYHNVIMTSNSIAVTNFDKVSIGVELLDLYHFLRKVMEKNNWNVQYGSAVLEEYNKVLSLSKEKMEVLYVLLLYPEKFWKVTNYYYNSKKSWISQKNIHKLTNLEMQTKEKEKFLGYMENQF